MINFNLRDDTGFKYKVGDISSGINNLPIYGSFRTYKKDLLHNSSTSISSHQTADIYGDFPAINDGNKMFLPIAIIGIDASIAYYCNIQKFYMEYATSGACTVYVRIANGGSGSYTVSRLYVHMLYALVTNNFSQDFIYDFSGGDIS